MIEAVLVQVGDRVRLVCDYAEGRDQLYSVKWYKDNMEFYRCRLVLQKVASELHPKVRNHGEGPY